MYTLLVLVLTFGVVSVKLSTIEKRKCKFKDIK